MHRSDPIFPIKFHEPVTQILRAARSNPSVPVIDYFHKHPLRGSGVLGNEELHASECVNPDSWVHYLHKWNPGDIQEDLEASRDPSG